MQTFIASRQVCVAITGVLALMGCVSAGAGDITHHDFPSDVTGKDYPYTIYLPDGYEQNELEYPTLYLLHGSFGNENDWSIKGDVKQSVDRLIEEGEIPHCVPRGGALPGIA